MSLHELLDEDDNFVHEKEKEEGSSSSSSEDLSLLHASSSEDGSNVLKDEDENESGRVEGQDLLSEFQLEGEEYDDDDDDLNERSYEYDDSLVVSETTLGLPIVYESFRESKDEMKSFNGKDMDVGVSESDETQRSVVEVLEGSSFDNTAGNMNGNQSENHSNVSMSSSSCNIPESLEKDGVENSVDFVVDHKHDATDDKVWNDLTENVERSSLSPSKHSLSNCRKVTVMVSIRDIQYYKRFLLRGFLFLTCLYRNRFVFDQ